MEHRFSFGISEVHVLKRNFALDFSDRDSALRILVLRFFCQNVGCSFESGHSFGKLRTDAYDLRNRRDEHRQKCDISEKRSQRHRSGEDTHGAEIQD